MKNCKVSLLDFVKILISLLIFFVLCMYLCRQNQASNALGSSMMIRMKKFTYMSPARFFTFKLSPKYTSALTNLAVKNQPTNKTTNTCTNKQTK